MPSSSTRSIGIDYRGLILVISLPLLLVTFVLFLMPARSPTFDSLPRLRQLEGDASDRILQAVRDFLKHQSSLKSKSDWVTVIDRNQEGAYQWVCHPLSIGLGSVQHYSICIKHGLTLSKNQIDSALDNLTDWVYECCGTVSSSGFEHTKLMHSLTRSGCLLCQEGIFPGPYWM